MPAVTRSAKRALFVANEKPAKRIKTQVSAHLSVANEEPVKQIKPQVSKHLFVMNETTLLNDLKHN